MLTFSPSNVHHNSYNITDICKHIPSNCVNISYQKCASLLRTLDVNMYTADARNGPWYFNTSRYRNRRQLDASICHNYEAAKSQQPISSARASAAMLLQGIRDSSIPSKLKTFDEANLSVWRVHKHAAASTDPVSNGMPLQYECMRLVTT